MADRGEPADRGLLAVGEVRVAVPELFGEVELEPLGELGAPSGGVPVEGEAVEHLLRRLQVALPVPPPLRLAALERRPAADCDEDVLEQRAPRVVRVDVPRCHGLDPEVLREVAEESVPAGVSPLERPLELDEEAVGAERLREARCRVRVAGAEPAARTAREADEALVQLRHQLERHQGAGADRDPPSPPGGSPHARR